MISDRISAEKPISQIWFDFNIFNFLKILKTNRKLRITLISFFIFQIIFLTLLTIFPFPTQLWVGLIPVVIVLFLINPLVITVYARMQNKNAPNSQESVKSESKGSIFPVYITALGIIFGFSVILGASLSIIVLIFASISVNAIFIFFVIFEIALGLMFILLVYMVMNYYYMQLKDPSLTFRKNIHDSWIDAKDEWNKIFGLLFSRSLFLIPFLVLVYIIQFGILWLISQMSGLDFQIGSLFNPGESFFDLFSVIFIVNSSLILENFVFVQRIHEKNT